MRVMTAHRRGRSDGLNDDLHPDRSLMMDGWVTIEFEKLMAITWVPGVGAEEAILEALGPEADRSIEEVRQVLHEKDLVFSFGALQRFFKRHAITRKKRPRTPPSRTAPTS